LISECIERELERLKAGEAYCHSCSLIAWLLRADVSLKEMMQPEVKSAKIHLKSFRSIRSEMDKPSLQDKKLSKIRSTL